MSAAVPRYKLTEEVVRQAVEVAFKNDPRWQICFSNPTAGPWKKIQVGKYVTGGELKYLKEEDRPDLILFSRDDGLFFVLEAKDTIRGLLTSQQVAGQTVYTQLGKSVTVFGKEFTRVDGILSNSSARDLVGLPSKQDHVQCPGYVFAATDMTLGAGYSLLHDVHSRLAQAHGDSRLRPFLCFVVHKDASSNLEVYYKLADGPESLSKLIAASLPTTIKALS